METLGYSFAPANAIAMVTGASRGIGRAVAIALARAGFDLWVNYKSNHDAAQAVKTEVEGLGRNCRLLSFDVSDPAAVDAALDALLTEATPHVLVNNAGITRDAIMAWMGFDQWHEVLHTTLDGFFLVTKKVIPGMLKRRDGRIINIASTSGQAGRPGQVNYAAAKAGLLGATKALAMEIGRRGILVNAVAPGMIATDMTAGFPMDQVLPAIPLGRIGTAEEVAGVVTFLCSPQSTYLNGAVINCNGGLYV